LGNDGGALNEEVNNHAGKMADGGENDEVFSRG
jgi:hypothetical protein